jgi:RimJ/RimL family protein N-acetyltransferase
VVEFSQLNTERLVLRTMECSDAEGYAELLSDPSTHPFITESGPVPSAEIPERIRRNRDSSAAGTNLYWSIELDGVFVGYVALHGADASISALSYATRPAWRRQGIAREALEAICQSCRSGSPNKDLVARTHEKNTPSAELLLQLGFGEIGTVDTPQGRRREFKLLAAQQADEVGR